MIDQSISVVFPAYNEETNILGTLKSSASFLKKNFNDWEIVVVNDGSRDNTKKVIDQFKINEKRIRLINHPTNFGYGAAVWDGIKVAKKDLVFFADSDGQFDIKELKKFVEEIGESDAVLGYRKKRNDRFMRKLNALGWKIICFAMLGIRVRDIDCAFKLFKRKKVQNLEIRSKGATFSAELLYKFKKQGGSIKQLPVSHFERKSGRATGAKFSVILKAFDEIWKIYSADQDLVKKRTALGNWLSVIILFVSRLAFLSGSADFFDSSQYMWRSKIPQLLKVMATGHAPFHPLYNLFNAIFYKIGFHNSAIATSLPSAIFGSLSIVFLFLVLRKLFGSKIAYLASFIYAISPFIWVSQITSMVDATEHCFYFLALLLFLKSFDFNSSKKYLFATGAGIAFGLAIFTHTQVGMWVLPIILIPIIVSKVDKAFVWKYLKQIILFGLFGSLSIVAYLGLFHLAPTYQPDISKVQSNLEYLKYLLVGNISDKNPISWLKLFNYLRDMTSVLVLLVAFFGAIEMAFKKTRKFLLLLVWALPIPFASSYIYENLYGRAMLIGLVPIFVMASYFILNRKGWVRNLILLLVIGQLLIISLPVVLRYSKYPSRNEDLVAQEKEVEPGGTFVATNVNKTWASYDGTFVPFGDVGYGAGYAKEQILSSLNSGHPAYVSSVAIDYPDRRFDGMNYDLRSAFVTKAADTTILNDLFNQFSLDLVPLKSARSDLRVYQVENKDTLDLSSIEKSLDSLPNIVFGQFKTEEPVKNLSVDAYTKPLCRLGQNDISAFDLIFCAKRYITHEQNLDGWTFTDKRGYFALPVSDDPTKLEFGVSPTATNTGVSVSGFMKRQQTEMNGNLVGTFNNIDDLRFAINKLNGSYYVRAQNNNEKGYKLFTINLNLESTTKLEAEDLSGQIGQVEKDSQASGGLVRSSEGATSDGYLISGPYLNLKKGKYTLNAYLKSEGSGDQTITFDSTADYGRISLGKIQVNANDLRSGYKKISLEISPEKDVASTEFRVFVPKGANIQLDYIELTSH